MISFQEYMLEYKKQLEKGSIQVAYRGLMDYINFLKGYFKKKYPDYFVSGSIYFGYMDMTYFAFFPASLKRRRLKVGVVFNHLDFRFEVWLFGVNKKIQAKYIKLIGEIDWKKYNIASSTKGVDFIIWDILVENPDFSDLNILTEHIENGILQFIETVEDFLVLNKIE
jgi:hypothetical protein